jgi:hypothetical protein
MFDRWKYQGREARKDAKLVFRHVEFKIPLGLNGRYG